MRGERNTFVEAKSSEVLLDKVHVLCFKSSIYNDTEVGFGRLHSYKKITKN